MWIIEEYHQPPEWGYWALNSEEISSERFPYLEEKEKRLQGLNQIWRKTLSVVHPEAFKTFYITPNTRIAKPFRFVTSLSCSHQKQFQTSTCTCTCAPRAGMAGTSVVVSGQSHIEGTQAKHRQRYPFPTCRGLELKSWSFEQIPYCLQGTTVLLACCRNCDVFTLQGQIEI